jgi:hypothetical protein
LVGAAGLDGAGVDAALQAIVQVIDALAFDAFAVTAGIALALLVLLARRVARFVVPLLLRGAGLALLVLLIGLPALVVRRLLLQTFAVGFVAHGGRSLIAPEASGGEINGAACEAFLSR